MTAPTTPNASHRVEVPVLETERLRLRAPRAADFDHYGPVLMSDRARYIGGPFERGDAWRDFAADAGSWVLLGFGYWAIEVRESGAFVGATGFMQPRFFPECEFGWVMVDGFEGRGYAFEAARAARTHAFEAWGWETLVSYIEPENARSIRLAERLGAVEDTACDRPFDDVLVYRHLAVAGTGRTAA